MTATGARERLRLRVSGTVQGVGFRPFVYRLADRHGLGGWVLNDEHGVLAEVEGEGEALRAFVAALRTQAPPLAVVEAVTATPLDPTGERAFAIVASERGPGDGDGDGVAGGRAPITPDGATCPDCLAELRDPADRRYRYPFINCTNCGPRLTIVRGVPYDRPRTTMAAFPMCERCAREYEDPLDRRFHAQPNACPECGPRVRVTDGDGRPLALAPGARDGVEHVARALAAGAIVAVKSIGGFHLVCDGADERAVAALRARKHREDKPLALMVASVAAAARLVALSDDDLALMGHPARPIVLAPRRAGAPVAAAVAPGVAELGVMLAYAPLHHMLLADVARAGDDPERPLVMTSGNASDDPIAHRDDDALARLRGIADLFLLHDREIETRTDDSVARTVALPGGRAPLLLRRSRGYVPAPLTLPVAAPRPLLAVGAEQKSTFCLATGTRAWVSHHIGDLEHYEALRAFRDGVAHFERLFELAPELVVCDLHPDYLSTRYAEQRFDGETIAVQHHHAHLAAVLAEHGETGPALAAVYDGTGLGVDGTVWGGELLAGDLAGVERAGSLWPVAMPGGAAAVRQPWRMAAAWLAAAADPDPDAGSGPVPVALRSAVDPARWAAVARVGADRSLSPVTSSAGRLLDAIAALCGLGAEITYEGQAAIALEGAAWRAGAAARRYEIGLAGDPGGGLVLDPRALVRKVAADVQAGESIPAIAAGVHAALSATTATALTALAAALGLDTVVLAGGVFQNRMLLQDTAAACAAGGLRVLVPRRLPPNDGQISFGQAAVAAAQSAHSPTSAK